MPRDDLLLAPESLEALIAGFSDLATALGPAAADGLEAVRRRLEKAAAARADGRREQATADILMAMQELARLAHTLDPVEAQAMQGLAASFQVAITRGDAGHAAESVDSMRQRSGAVKKRGDEFKL